MKRTLPKGQTGKGFRPVISVFVALILALPNQLSAQEEVGSLPEVSFDTEYVFVNENDGFIDIDIQLSEIAAYDATVDVVSGAVSATAQNGADYLFSPGVISFSAGSNLATLTVPVLNNSNQEIDRFFALKLENFDGCVAGEHTTLVVYILDDDYIAPMGTEELDVEFASSYLVDADGSAEIVAFNKPNKRLYVMNSTANRVEILDFSDPRNITPISSVDLSPYGSGATSLACNNAFVVAAVDGFEGEPGNVVFMNKNGVVLGSAQVGFLPDMVTFTPDNKFVLVANEGEPNSDYSFDPEGSISMVPIAAGVGNPSNNPVIHMNFNAFDSQIDELRAAGVRIFGLNATVSQDLEPEYIAVSEDSKTAWVSLQENNAIAVLDLEEKVVSAILPLGTKDHSLPENSIDVSDRNDSIFMSTWNIKGMYMPDAIAHYSVNGVDYIVTANEGDQREFGPIDEDVNVRDDAYVLDPVSFPDAALLKEDHMLGRLAVSPYNGDIDGDGDFDEIYSFGSRSFSIWNGATGALVYDSGDDFERITAADPVYGALFNASNSNNNFKNRSDNKGPEPEGVTVAEIDGQHYAFVTLERTGGFMTYNITNPSAPEFISYRNNRDLGEDEGGDLAPEGIIYIDPKSSPVDTALVVIANEESSTVSVYYINNVTRKKGNNKSLADDGSDNAANTEIAAVDKELSAVERSLPALEIYPNPVSSGMVFLSRPATFNMFDLSGQLVLSGTNKAYIDVSNEAPGMYLLKTASGESLRLIVE